MSDIYCQSAKKDETRGLNKTTIFPIFQNVQFMLKITLQIFTGAFRFIWKRHTKFKVDIVLQHIPVKLVYL